mmetsp:Transcript_91077/g.257878  ORF Transcript_91077/g.257878 Transcript_91077/m.257878 type:complete len:278 (-) Transcript_91077:152-985(-)
MLQLADDRFLCEELLTEALKALVPTARRSGLPHRSSKTAWSTDRRCIMSGCRTLAAFSQTCRAHRATVAAAGLWRRAITKVFWPVQPRMARNESDSGHLAVDAQLKILRNLGSSCRHLRSNCMELQPGDLAAIVEHCPSVEVLELSYYGPEGTGSLEWVSSWGPTLKCLAIHFWYDAILGPPLVFKLLREIGERCKRLEDLWLTGVDWPRAKDDIARVLQSPEMWSGLRRLHVEGTQPFATPDFAHLQRHGVTTEALGGNTATTLVIHGGQAQSSAS